MKKERFTPPQLLVLSFAILILLGSLLLSTPWAVREGSVNFLTSLFTATSAVCVTGLVVADTATHWTNFGQLIILLLIQVGGLGVMSFATFFAILFGRRIQLRQRLIMQQALNESSVGGIVRIFRYLLLFSFSIEAIGAIILTVHWIPLMGYKQALWYGLFHSVSSFNNAGFDLFGGFRSLTGFTTDITVNLTISFLIILGGLGFVVIYELLHFRRKQRLTLHTKVVLITTAVLILSGTLLLFAVEYNHALKDLSFGGKIMAAYFQSVSPRTAGYNTIDLNSLFISSQFLIILLMFIGGSPGSTAGGIKTTTFALLWIAIFSQLRGKRDNEIFERHIPDKDMFQVLTIALLSGATLFVMSFILTVLHPAEFMKVVFEVASALGTVGLTLGLTPQLHPLEQILIIITMFLGRLGPLTIGFALAYKNQQVNKRYPEGKIIIG